MDLLDRDLSHVKLSVTHKRLHELHPADVADILEQLSPRSARASSSTSTTSQAADTISELEDEFQADVIDDLGEPRASDILEEMDPDDAADIIGDLPYDKAEALLRLMGLEKREQIRKLLGYREKTAGGIMTPEVTTVTEDMTVQEVIEHLRADAEEQRVIYYVYVAEATATSGRHLAARPHLAAPDTPVAEIASASSSRSGPDDDQEDVAEQMSKYDLLALPVVDEMRHACSASSPSTTPSTSSRRRPRMTRSGRRCDGTGRDRLALLAIWRSQHLGDHLVERALRSAAALVGLGEEAGPYPAAALWWAAGRADPRHVRGAPAAARPAGTAEEASSRAVAEMIEGDYGGPPVRLGQAPSSRKGRSARAMGGRLRARSALAYAWCAADTEHQMGDAVRRGHRPWPCC